MVEVWAVMIRLAVQQGLVDVSAHSGYWLAFLAAVAAALAALVVAPAAPQPGARRRRSQGSQL